MNGSRVVVEFGISWRSAWHSHDATVSRVT